MKQAKTIIWDWNGTLLNDVDICIDSINTLLQERDLDVLTASKYKEIFTFPVKTYYRMAGFDFSMEPFDVVAMKFMDLYRGRVGTCKVHRQVTEVLAWFRDNGYDQVMVSAMEHDLLMQSVEDAGIKDFFSSISGVSDHYANGKASMAEAFCSSRGIDRGEAVLIGDTLHDFEVAQQLHMNCILVSHGHQARERLHESGCQVVDSLIEVITLFKNGNTQQFNKKEQT